MKALTTLALLALLSTGCAFHASVNTRDQVKSQLWLGLDTDGSVEAPTLRRDRHIDVNADARLFPPALSLGAKVDTRAKEK